MNLEINNLITYSSGRSLELKIKIQKVGSEKIRTPDLAKFSSEARSTC